MLDAFTIPGTLIPRNYGPGGNANASSEIIPIQLKEALKRENFPGYVFIESKMHTMKTAGMWLESNIGDAQAWIQNELKALEKRITNYVHHQLNAMVAGTEPPPARIAAAVAAVVLFIKQVKEFITELLDLIQAIRDLILYFMSLIQRIQAYIQRILTAIATLIAEICNFHLPSLPSLPNLFGDLHFDGFKFTPGMLNFRLKFDTHFAFGNCRLWNSEENPLQHALQNWTNAVPIVYNPSGAIGSSMTNQRTFLPPTPTTGRFAPPVYDPQKDLDPVTGRIIPVLSPEFVPATGFLGSLPSPSLIVSPYSMTAQVFRSHALSLTAPGATVAAIIADQNPAGTVGTSPITTPVSQDVPVPWSQFIAPVRAHCQSHVSLEAIEDASLGWTSVTDGTAPAWPIVWSWLTFMNQCRRQGATDVEGVSTRTSVTGRGGAKWIPEFQAVFNVFVAGNTPADPSYDDIHRDVPWNHETRGFSSMAFFTRLAELDPATRGQVLWMLSFLEASLLGYVRSTRWDAFAPGGSLAPGTTHPLAVSFGTGPTGLDLDYRQFPAPTQVSEVTLRLDSGGLADYPSEIRVPDYLLPTMRPLIKSLEAEILNNPAYTSVNWKGMLVYSASATATLINSYSQYWRDVAANWDALNRQDAALRSMVFNYPRIMASALSPRSPGAPNIGEGVSLIGQAKDPYYVLRVDFETRVKNLTTVLAAGPLYQFQDPATGGTLTVKVPRLTFTGPSMQWTDHDTGATVFIMAATAPGEAPAVAVQGPHDSEAHTVKATPGSGTASAGFLDHYEDPSSAPLDVLWAPGWPWMKAPSIPQMFFETSPDAHGNYPTDPFGEPAYGFPVFSDDPANDGWDRVEDPDDPTKTVLAAFNREKYLQRQDIKARPYVEQQYLANMNQTFDDVVNTGALMLSDAQESIDSCYKSIEEAEALIGSLQEMASSMKDAQGNPILMDATGAIQVANGEPYVHGGVQVPGLPSGTAYTLANMPDLAVPPFTEVPIMLPPAAAPGDPDGQVPIVLPSTPGAPFFEGPGAPATNPQGQDQAPPAPDTSAPPHQAPSPRATPVSEARETRTLRCRKQILTMVASPA